jgi:hypothetical protein
VVIPGCGGVISGAEHNQSHANVIRRILAAAFLDRMNRANHPPFRQADRLPCSVIRPSSIT